MKKLRNYEITKKNVTVPAGAEQTLVIPQEAGEREMEIRLNPRSRLRLTYIQNGAFKEKSSLTLRIFVEEEAACETFAAVFGGAAAGLFLETHLMGEKSSLKERTLYFGDTDETFEMSSKTILEAADTNAEIISKGILNDRAHARFDGNIHITQTAQRGQGRLNEHTLLLSPDAKISAIPGLKIDTNDVVASHAAGVTRVDDDQLFYAESRGIPEAEATARIAEGFLMAEAKGLPEEKHIEKLIQKKLCRL